ncbi:MAG: hypothetical protein MN733_42715 [Nitrososphaera sp.]|nr:hypothetical protein [Nitrososphaera sp.]
MKRQDLFSNQLVLTFARFPEEHFYLYSEILRGEEGNVNMAELHLKTYAIIPPFKCLMLMICLYV